MSQIGRLMGAGIGTPIDTITGNVGGQISPTALGNINLLGVGAINVTGIPLTNTLEISIDAATEINDGSVRLATDLETLIGMSTTLAVNPAELNVKLGAQTINGLMYGQGGPGSMLGALNAATNGQLPIGNTGNPPTLATLTAGPGIGIANGAGTITISAGVLPIAYTNVNATPYLVLPADLYLSVDTSALLITIQLPNAPAPNTIFIIKDRTGNADIRNISVTTLGGAVLIDGVATFVMNTSYEAIMVLFNGVSFETF